MGEIDATSPLRARYLKIAYRSSAGRRFAGVAKGLRPRILRKRLRKKFKHRLRMVQSLGIWSIVAFRQLERAEGRSDGEAFVRIGMNRKIVLRAGTTDIDVFRQHFIRRELFRIPHVDGATLIVDLGAHIGIATEVFRRQYPNAKIVSVEMDPSNFGVCARNVKENRSQVLVNAAVWSASGTVLIEDVGEGNWAFRATSIASSEDSSIQTGVRAMSLSFSDLAERYELSEISILKIDIEGSEAELLESAWRDIFAITTLVVMEIHDWIPGVRARVDEVLRVARSEFDLTVSQAGEFTCIQPTPRLMVPISPRQAVSP